MQTAKLMFVGAYLFLFMVLSSNVFAQAGPKVLVVNAHPDDETSFPILLYKITHDLKGTADLALLTDGSGGFNAVVGLLTNNYPSVANFTYSF